MLAQATMQVALVSGKFERTDVVLGVSDEQEITQWRFQAAQKQVHDAGLGQCCHTIIETDFLNDLAKFCACDGVVDTRFLL